jgi:capsular exopolysaccharide synthesis family protein
MQKVMQKLRVKPDAGADVAVLAPPDENPGAAPIRSTEPQVGGFAPDPVEMQIPVESSASPTIPATPAPTAPAADPIVVDQRTIEWDAAKLDPSLIAFHEKFSATSEQYRSFRARLLNMNAQHRHQMIAITSSLPQEGKSVTTLNLGMVMAEGADQKVLVIDADFRRSSIARMLGVSPRPGLTELIRGDADFAEVIRPTHYPNLKIITTGGTSDKNYGALLGASNVRPVLQKLRDAFDYCFVDTPPVNTVSDVSMLAPHCDGVVIVIEMRRTPEPSVLEAVRTLQTTNAKILGCLLSQSDDQRGHYYERYYSYYDQNE